MSLPERLVFCLFLLVYCPIGRKKKLGRSYFVAIWFGVIVYFLFSPCPWRSKRKCATSSGPRGAGI